MLNTGSPSLESERFGFTLFASQCQNPCKFHGFLQQPMALEAFLQLICRPIEALNVPSCPAKTPGKNSL